MGDDDQNEHKKSHRSKKRRRGDDEPSASHLLLIYAGLGKARKCRKLLKKRDVNVDCTDSEGSTPLHQVCMWRKCVS